MGKKIVAGYLIFCIVFAVALLAFIAIRVKTSWDDNRFAAQEYFDGLERKISSLYLGHRFFDAPPFLSGVRELLDTEQRLLVLAIYSPDQGTKYLHTRSRYYVEGPDSIGRPNSGRPVYRDLPRGSIILSLPFSQGIDEIHTIDGVFSIFGRSDIFPIIKEVFLILFVFFVATCIVLLLMPAAQTAEESQEPHPAEDRVVRHWGVRGRGLPSARPSNGSVNGGKGPQNLFSPRTGLGWREHLQQRLKFELDRSASFDQDLVLVLLSIDDFSLLTSSDDIYGQIAKKLLNAFTFQDCAFEYEDGVFALVIPDTDLDQGIQSLESFKTEISSKPFMSQHLTLSVGLSSRNGRLVNGATLLTEASRALNKAIQLGPNGIIAFRADPQKYRDIISKKV